MRSRTVEGISHGEYKVAAVRPVDKGSVTTREQDASKPLTVLFTSVGNQAFPTAPSALRTRFARCRIIGTDIRTAAHGLYLCDQAYLVNKRDCESFLSEIFHICDAEQVDVLFPLSTGDQDYFSTQVEAFQPRGTRVIVSSADAVRTANSKLLLYSTLAEAGLVHPRFHVITPGTQITDVLGDLGYPDEPVVIKSATGMGGSGVWIVAADPDELGPTNRQFFVNRDRLVADWDRLTGRNPCCACEYLPGEEYSVDTLSRNGSFLYGVVRKRYEAYRGLALDAVVVDEPDVLAYARAIIDCVGLSYVNNVQVKRDRTGVPKVMEVNPRIPGTISLSQEAGADFVGDAVSLAIGEPVSPPSIRYGMRILRFWSGIYVEPGSLHLVKDLR